MTKVITTGNFKGGVGKTTNAVMISYELFMLDYKTLLVDFDPQANATDMLNNTLISVHSKYPDFKMSVGKALQTDTLNEAIIEFNENLDYLPSFTDLQNYEQDFNFKKHLNKIKINYDYVIIDVPPQLNKFTDSALVASDGSVANFKSTNQIKNFFKTNFIKMRIIMNSNPC